MSVCIDQGRSEHGKIVFKKTSRSDMPGALHSYTSDSPDTSEQTVIHPGVILGCRLGILSAVCMRGSLSWLWSAQSRDRDSDRH